MYQCLIVSAPLDYDARWHTIGVDRAEAERYWLAALESGEYHRPSYRVIATRKPVRQDDLLEESA